MVKKEGRVDMRVKLIGHDHNGYDVEGLKGTIQSITCNEAETDDLQAVGL